MTKNVKSCVTTLCGYQFTIHHKGNSTIKTNVNTQGALRHFDPLAGLLNGSESGNLPILLAV